MSYKLASIPLDRCRLEGNIRESVVDDEIRQMADSLRKRQIHPLIVMEDGRVIDGGKRVRAARLAGLSELLAVITDEPLNATQILEIQIIAAFHRSDPSNYDKYLAIEAVKAAHEGWTNKQIADHLDLDPKMVKILRSPGLCLPEVRDALRENRIGISVCHEISLLEPTQQIELLEQTLSGVSRDEIARQGRKHRKGDAPAVRVARSKFALASGNVVTLAGNDVSLEEAAKELSDLAADMRKAERDGITIKTYVARCRDRVQALV